MSDRNPCQSCSAPSTLWICPRCVEELKAQLHSLAHGPEVNGKPTAGLLDALADVALKRTCMGGGGGHRKKGDERPDPFEPQTEKGRQTAQGRASMLLDTARNGLSTMIRDLSEHRGAADPKLDSTAEMAHWLAGRVHSIALDEAAGQWRAEVDSLVRSIERSIDRPPMERFCGVCTHGVEKNGRTEQCGLALYAKRDAIEVTCPNRLCRTTYNIETLFRSTINGAEHMRFTREMLIGNQRSTTAQAEQYHTGIMGQLEEFVHWRTFARWLKDGELKVAGYLRPDGRRGNWRRNDEDEPEYRLSEVRSTRRKMEARKLKFPTKVGAK